MYLRLIFLVTCISMQTRSAVSQTYADYQTIEGTLVYTEIYENEG